MKKYINEAKRYLDIFPYTETKCLLSATTTASRSSTYWKILKQIEKEYINT